MNRFIYFCLLGILATPAKADVNISIEAGLSNYSFLTLGQDVNRNEVRQGNLITRLETRASNEGHVNPAIGFSIDTSVNSDFLIKLSAMYLGRPKLEREYSYISGLNSVEQTEKNTFKHHFSSISATGSYRIFEKLYLDLGYGHFFERAKKESESIEIVDGVVRAFEITSEEYTNDEGHLTFGLTTQVKWFNRSDLQFRWQHLQSMYGPVELFTLGLVY